MWSRPRIVEIMHRKPDAWRIASWVSMSRMGSAPNASAPVSTMRVLMIDAGMAETRTFSDDGKRSDRSQNPVPLHRSMVREAVVTDLEMDPVLSGLLPRGREMSGPPTEQMKWVAVSAPIDSAVDGRAARKLEVKLGNYSRGFVWIDKTEGVITRSVIAAGGMNSPYGPPQHYGMPPSGMGAGPNAFRETFYRRDFSRPARADDLDIPSRFQEEPDGDGVAGFSEAVELAKLFEAPAPSATPTATAPTAPATSEPLVQALGFEQMKSLVVVEGDDSAGSGFLAQIKGVPFVVTNLHVVGGNKTLRIRTLAGQDIRTGAIFGAIGRDIAILRVEGEPPAPGLVIAEDSLRTASIGNKVAVIGNRRGGGVATQTQGSVIGVGPDRIEVDAQFQSGNSGSPMVDLKSGEVVGVATFSLTRRLDESEIKRSGGNRDDAVTEEQRWFGFRLDGVSKWEVIDLGRWNQQQEKLDDFSNDSIGLLRLLQGNTAAAMRNDRVAPILRAFEERYSKSGGNDVIVARHVTTLTQDLRGLAERGRADLKKAEFYDFFRTSLYWQSNVNQQLEFRASLVKALERIAAEKAGLESRIRNGNR